MKPSLWTLNEKNFAQFHSEDIHYDIDCTGSSIIKSSTTDNNHSHTGGEGSYKQSLEQANKKNGGSVSCFAPIASNQPKKLKDVSNSIANGSIASQQCAFEPGLVLYEGELLKLGKKTEMWVKRHFVLKD